MPLFKSKITIKKALILLAHPDSDASFNHHLVKQAQELLENNCVSVDLIDLYKEDFDPILTKEECRGKKGPDMIEKYQARISDADLILFFFPIWWGRAPAILEGFLDRVFTVGYAYRFKKLFGTYGMPIPLLKNKHAIAFVTHGAPALPVKIVLQNSPLHRFLNGFLHFCFERRRTAFVPFWAVPFVKDSDRNVYVNKMKKILTKLL